MDSKRSFLGKLLALACVPCVPCVAKKAEAEVVTLTGREMTLSEFRAFVSRMLHQSPTHYTAVEGGEWMAWPKLAPCLTKQRYCDSVEHCTPICEGVHSVAWVSDDVTQAWLRFDPVNGFEANSSETCCPIIFPDKRPRTNLDYVTRVLASIHDAQYPHPLFA